MLIYSAMSPHGASNPLGLLTGPSERQITLLLGRSKKNKREFRSGEREGKKRWCFSKKSWVEATDKRREITGWGFKGEVERGEERRGDGDGDGETKMMTKRRGKQFFSGEEEGKMIRPADQRES